MKQPIKKKEGQIQVNIPKSDRLEAIMDIASSNEQIAIALRNAAESNIQLAKALQVAVSPQITITDCSIISNGHFDTGIRIDTEPSYDEYKEEYFNSEEDEKEECCSETEEDLDYQI